MSTFGKRLRECREAKKLSQQDLAKLMKTVHTVIGKYELDKMKPSIEVASRLAKVLDTTVAHLIGEVDTTNVLKDPDMLNRMNELNSLSEPDKGVILYAIDGLIRDAKTRKAYGR